MGFQISNGVLKKYTEVKGVTEVVIPDGVQKIGEQAFYECKNLTSVIISDSVTDIEAGAFSYCFNLTSITIPGSVKSIDNYTFYECKNLISVTIPDSVKSIGDSAFEGCSSLTSVTIPDSVTSMGSGAFCECGSLKNITIPDSVTSIDCSTFSYCGNLLSITIPDSVTIIDDGAFEGCGNLTSVTIPDSVTSIGNSAFAECESLTSVTIPDSVISINDFAFSKCSALTNITIPKTVKKIGQGCFQGSCCECKEITVYDSLDPDAKPCKSHLDNCNGTPNSWLGTIVNFEVNYDEYWDYEWSDYEITVRSAKTNEIKYKVWMGADRTQKTYRCTLLSSWGRNATFNFNAVDEFFPKIKGTYHKIKVALNRLHYPIDLTDEQKEMYRSYIVCCAENAVKLCIDTDDMELLLSCEPLGIIKKNNIDELLEYATEKKAVQFTAYLLEYKESHFNKRKNVLDSLKL